MPGVSGWMLVPLLLLVIRPAAVLLSLVRTRESLRERAFVGWFGVRGIGSLFYASVVIGLGAFSAGETRIIFWTVAVVVIVSIAVHGISATPLDAPVASRTRADGRRPHLERPGPGPQHRRAGDRARRAALRRRRPAGGACEALAGWEAALAHLGYPHVAGTLPPDGAPRAPERRLGVVVASRTPIELVPAVEVPWPERYLVARTRLDGELVELHDVHAPISQKADLVKVRTLEAVHAALATASDVPRVLVGDLNTPRYESREGDVQSFARTRTGRIRPSHGERHDRAELLLITGLREHGYVDAFRDLHGYARRDRSWLYPHRKTGYRLDHIIVRGLEVAACEYEHAWRDAGLSDHAAMWADLRVPAAAGSPS